MILIKKKGGGVPYQFEIQLIFQLKKNSYLYEYVSSKNL